MDSSTSSEPLKKRRRPALSCEQCKIVPCTYSGPHPPAAHSTAFEPVTRANANIAPFAQSVGRTPSIDQALIRAVESVEYPTPASARSQDVDSFGYPLGSGPQSAAQNTPAAQPVQSVRSSQSQENVSDMENLRSKMKQIEQKLSEPVKARTTNEPTKFGNGMGDIDNTKEPS